MLQNVDALQAYIILLQISPDSSILLRFRMQSRVLILSSNLLILVLDLQGHEGLTFTIGFPICLLNKRIFQSLVYHGIDLRKCWPQLWFQSWYRNLRTRDRWTRFALPQGIKRKNLLGPHQNLISMLSSVDRVCNTPTSSIAPASDRLLLGAEHISATWSGSETKTA